MQSYTIKFFQYLTGLRNASTSDSEKELSHLEKLASTSKVIVEVGVFEGVASARMAKCLPENGCIYLVDPYFPGVKLERFFNFSMAEYIARRQMKPYKKKSQFIREPSVEAARHKEFYNGCDLVFIDARHDYDSVLEDFRVWQSKLTENGIMAFHDSRICPARPDLDVNVGPVKLVTEIEAGLHGGWKVLDAVDSISVIQKS